MLVGRAALVGGFDGDVFSYFNSSRIASNGSICFCEGIILYAIDGKVTLSVY